MNKRKLLPLLIAACLLLVTLCGGVLAYMFRRTEQKKNTFTPAVVDCVVDEAFDGAKKTAIAVTNTGNIDAYLRVRLVTYWVDAAGNIAPKPSAQILLTLPEGWIAGSDNTYYYTKAVTPADSTTDLLGDIDLPLAQDGDYHQVIEVFAEAIQSQPAQAVTDSWGVTLTGDIISAAP